MMATLTRWLKNRILDYRIHARYGTANPDRISLIDSTNVVHLDPRDFRARKKIIMSTVRGHFPRNQRFWRAAIRQLCPDTILDIGLNYGECLFSMEYPESSRLFAFEANPALQKFVHASRDEHPNRSQMELLFQLVTDIPEGYESFYVDREWSGGSSGAISAECIDSARYEKISVRKTSIDAALREHHCQPRNLFFKIDIEGFEEKAIRGMRQTLDQVEQATGFIEFDVELLQRAGTDVARYWSDLQAQFRIYVFDRKNRIHPGANLNLQALKNVCGKHLHTDLVLCKGGDPAALETLLQEFSGS